LLDNVGEFKIGLLKICGTKFNVPRYFATSLALQKSRPRDRVKRKDPETVLMKNCKMHITTKKY